MADLTASGQAAKAIGKGDNPPPKGSRLSFASVAALAASKPMESPSTAALAENVRTIANGKAANSISSVEDRDIPTEALRESVARLNVDDHSGPITASSDLETQTPVSETLRFDDEKTHLSFVSNPTVSTDVRSVVSGTTFGIDEKESIRPDESASVKAAEEDDSTSGANSGGPQSVAGSEPGKAFRDQFYEISGAKQALPLTANLVQRMPDETGRTGAAAATMAYVYPQPDEKLVEALSSQRDRMFLLQMEQQVISFVKNSKEQVLHLPPSNAFCRLLAHRLGDYYNLAHTAEHGGSVRLGKTDNSRLPPPLSDFASQQSPAHTAPVPQPALKIMRRAEKGSATPQDSMSGNNSPAPASSKDGSEYSGVGRREFIDVKDPSPAKDSKRPTLEEREAKYNARREELYKDVPEKRTGENSGSASRASSTLGASKPKKRQPKNDDFEPRSVYMNMGYPNTQQQGYAFANRHPQPAYPYPQAANAMNPDGSPQNFNQIGINQPNYMPGTNKAYGNMYPQNQNQMYYDPNFTAFGMIAQQGGPMSPFPSSMPGGQQPAAGPQYAAPFHNGHGQNAPPFAMHQFDPSYQTFNPSAGQVQNMYPTNFHQQNFPPHAKQSGQYGSAPAPQYLNQAQPGNFYPGQNIGPMGQMYYPGNENNSMGFAGHPNQMYNSNIHGSPLPSGSKPAQSPQYKGSYGGASQAVTSGPSYPHTTPSNVASWAMPGKGRNSSRVEDFVVPRQGDSNAHSNSIQGQGGHGAYRQGQLNKYDTSSLPPKPPAPGLPAKPPTPI